MRYISCAMNTVMARAQLLSVSTPASRRARIDQPPNSTSKNMRRYNERRGTITRFRIWPSSWVVGKRLENQETERIGWKGRSKGRGLYRGHGSDRLGGVGVDAVVCPGSFVPWYATLDRRVSLQPTRRLYLYQIKVGRFQFFLVRLINLWHVCHGRSNISFLSYRGSSPTPKILILELFHVH
jgi:hypothetical protein